MAKRSYIILSLLTVGLMLVSCTGSKPADLEDTEIREYQGEKLSSINDFRENSIAGPQNVSLENYKLEITGLVDNPVALTYDQVLDRRHYSKVVTLHCVEGWDATILWEGVLIEDLLNPAGPQDSVVSVIFHAADGYTSSLPLEYIRQNKIGSPPLECCWVMRYNTALSILGRRR